MMQKIAMMAVTLGVACAAFADPYTLVDGTLTFDVDVADYPEGALATSTPHGSKKDIHLRAGGISTSAQEGYPFSRKKDILFRARGISSFAQEGYPLSREVDIPFHG